MHPLHAVTAGWNLGSVATAGLSSTKLACQSAKSRHTEILEDAECLTHYDVEETPRTSA